MVVCNRDRWVNRNKTDYPNHTTISVTEMVVCHRDRWVNRKITCNKINLSSYLYTTHIQIYSREYPKENFSFGVYNVIEEREEV